MRIVISHTKELDQWIKERHYLQSVPAGAKLRMWVLDDKGETIGAMMWGRPSARMLNKDLLLELTRMFFVNNTEPFVESRTLAMARKIIRKYMPKIKGLITYSSTGQGHDGVIYRADNWFPFGQTKGGKWNIRNGKSRKNIDTSPKIRWLRSP